MTIFLLTPTDVESDQWNGSSYKGEVIVRAKDQDQAMHLADSRFWKVRDPRLSKDSPIRPWRSPELVTCETIDDWEGETDGPPEVLYPVTSVAVDDLRREAQNLRTLAYQADRCTDDLRPLGDTIYKHLLGQASTVAIQSAEVSSQITDWANEVKETGEPDLLPKIAPGLRKIADELDRQATWPN